MNLKRNHQWSPIYLVLSLITLSWLLLGSSPANAQNRPALQNPNTIFYQADGCYQKGEYPKASELYNRLVDAGYQSGNLYFNLGNTYFKLGQKGKAILYYEKAKQLMPSDADLRSNLEFALNGVDEGNSNWQTDLYQTVVSLGSLDNLLVLTSCIFFALAAYLISMIMFPTFFRVQNSGKLKSWCLGTLLGIGVFFILSLSVTAFTGIDHTKSHAVAVQAGGLVKFEPNPQSTTYYHLAEGTRVRILEKKAHWVLIQRRDGKLGWIENQFVAEI